MQIEHQRKAGGALAACALLALAACGGAPGPEGASLRHPAAKGARLAGLAQSVNGAVWLAWTEGDAEDARLLAAPLQGSRFGHPREAARGRDWFLNWADLPALGVHEDGSLAAVYLAKTGTGAYDYAARLVLCRDACDSWSGARTLHDDAGPGEHGFVALTPLGPGRFAASWLDGRRLSRAPAGGEAMALYARVFDSKGELGPEVELDARVCDCCPTAAVQSGDGALLVAYRDRSEDELRDVALVRFFEGEAPQALWRSVDGWRIDGCPVNGPALAARGQDVALAWFTRGADDVPRVLAATLGSFGRGAVAVASVAHGRALGQPRILFDVAGRLVVLWLEEREDGAHWRLARRARLDQGEWETRDLADTQAGRAAGRAHMVRTAEGLVVALPKAGGFEVRSLAWR